jgi:hypothetical protein
MNLWPRLVIFFVKENFIDIFFSILGLRTWIDNTKLNIRNALTKKLIIPDLRKKYLPFL